MALSWAEAWRVLEIEPTQDQTAIRRAYSRKLKVTNPEDVAEAFQRLREAYEMAGQYTQSVRWEEPQDPEEEQPFGTDDATFSTPVETPDAYQPADEPENAPSAAAIDLSSLQRAQARLTDLLTQRADEVELNAALKAVLDEPVLDHLGLQQAVESWLATLIVQSPAADPLVDPVTEHFGWDRPGAQPPPEAEAVLARRDAQRYFAHLQRPSEGRPALRALTQKPTRSRILAYRLTAGLARKVSDLLETLRWNHPRLLERLDDEALSWWDQFLSRPRLGAMSLYAAVWVPLFSAPLLVPALRRAEIPAIAENAVLLAFPFGLALWAVTVLGWLYGVLVPRARWHEAWSWRSPAWLKVGWAPASALSMTLAAGAAQSPSTAALAVLLLPAIIWWAIVTIDIDWLRARGGSLWSSAVMRVLVDTFALAVLWIVLVQTTPPLVGGVMFLSAMVFSSVCALGVQALWAAWSGLTLAARRGIVLAALAFTAVSPTLIWATQSSSVLTALLLALVTAVSMIDRVAVLDVGNKLALWRVYVLRGSLLILMLLIYREEIGRAAAAFYAVLLWFQAAVALGLLGAVRQMRVSRLSGG